MQGLLMYSGIQYTPGSALYIVIILKCSSFCSMFGVLELSGEDENQ